MERIAKGGLVAALLVSLMVPACALFAAARTPVYARVNGRAITSRDVMRRIAFFQLADPAHATAIGKTARPAAIVNRLVEESALLDRAGSEGVSVSAASVTKGRQSLERDLVAGIYRTQGALTAAERKLGLSQRDLDEFVRQQQVIGQLVGRHVAVAQPTSAAVSRYFASHRGNFVKDGQIRLVEVRTLSWGTAVAVKRAAVSGTDLAAAARRAGAKVVRNGAWVDVPTLDPSSRRLAAGLTPGVVSGIAKAGGGYAIVEVLARRSARPMTLAEAAPRIASLLKARSRAEGVTAYASQVRAGARISVSLPKSA